MESTQSLPTKTTDTPEQPSKDSCTVKRFVDVTSIFDDATKTLDRGELVHVENFRLHDAMLAIELMDPQMDMGMRTGSPGDYDTVNKEESQLDERQVLKLMDVMLGAMASWLDGGGLGETVFGCIFLVEKGLLMEEEGSGGERAMRLLKVFLKAVEGFVAVVRVIVRKGNVAEEEDFGNGWSGDIGEVDVEELSKFVRELCGGEGNGVVNGVSGDVERGLKARIEVVRDLYALVRGWKDQDHDNLMDVRNVAENVQRRLAVIRATIGCGAESLSKRIFDPQRNRNRAANIPPRNVALIEVEEAIDYFDRFVVELRALAEYRSHLLPRSQDDSPGFSFHCMLHALAHFSTKHQPRIVTRSLLKTLVFEVHKHPLKEANAGVLPMMQNDMGHRGKTQTAHEINVIASLVGHARVLQATLCRNRGRQHRYLLDFLGSWDRAAAFLMQAVKEQETDPLVDKTKEVKGKPADGSTPDKVAPKLTAAQMSKFLPLELILREISCRAMIIHFFLGLECDLYSPAEVPVVYFYIAYTLTTLRASTEKLLQDREWSSARRCLYDFDEARGYLSQSYVSLLEALSESEKWAYSWRGQDVKRKVGDTVYGSGNLRYQQRFLDVGFRIFGPRYVSHEDFTEVVEGRKKLVERLCKENEDDPFMIRLSETSRNLQQARRCLDKARKRAKELQWGTVKDEAISLTRIIITNLIATTKFSEVHKSGYLTSPTSSFPIRVQFRFDANSHFPVVEFAAVE
eukprot:Plantae.Rhodophyta-Hildenbrandia_rubra.ctg11195.p1 GENE.Plantae.Rhodophyta-Hildenbrandia_rubra.ctg11195~~Plantae.Rhodophyta-Hildenbrandia_rubra.ctg11195.p1  ORF type:complete len:743 (+),score=135.74 Plantae.Rhodophyta-Hildenbrandia_rubra.ctg11195:3416-5644(+)